MEELKIIGLTHYNLPIEELGKFHLDINDSKDILQNLKSELCLSELLYISTCNRVEFVFCTKKIINKSFIRNFLRSFLDKLTTEKVDYFVSNTEVFEAQDAARHLFKVASSLDSLVVGEREIITQVRKAYELCLKYNLTGDTIRLLIKKTIETAKSVYTNTAIARNPVSVSYLAFSKLKDLGIKSDAKILILGAGQTNTTMAKFLKKHGYSNFHIYNRTYKNATKLVKLVGGKAHRLNELGIEKSFDVILSCTGSENTLIDAELFKSITNENSTQNTAVIDLAVPADISRDVQKLPKVSFIEIEGLKKLADSNLAKRKKELHHCELIIENNIKTFEALYKERQVELLMRHVPQQVIEIRQNALQNIFAEDIQKMDKESKVVLDKVLSYIEKKYISVPMKMAKEVILNKNITD